MPGGSEDLRSELREYIMSRAPGMLIALNMYAERRFGKNFIDLCLTDVTKALSILKEVYNDELIAQIIYDILIKRKVSNSASGGGGGTRSSGY